MSTPPSYPVERMVSVLEGLTRLMVTWGLAQRIAQWAVNLIVGRNIAARDRLRRLAARLAAGTYRPRRHTPRTAPPPRQPRVRNPVLQKFGWLDPALPEVARIRGEFRLLFEDPEVRALIAAAPAEMARILRPILWAIKVRPPDFLPAPKRPPRPARKPAEQPPVPLPAGGSHLHPRDAAVVPVMPAQAGTQGPRDVPPAEPAWLQQWPGLSRLRNG